MYWQYSLVSTNAVTVTFPIFNQFELLNTCYSKLNANNADNQLTTSF